MLDQSVKRVAQVVKKRSPTTSSFSTDIDAFKGDNGKYYKMEGGVNVTVELNGDITSLKNVGGLDIFGLHELDPSNSKDKANIDRIEDILKKADEEDGLTINCNGEDEGS